MLELILRKEVISDKTACRTIGVAVFLVLTCLGAFVRIPLPFTPVPITLQTFFVLLSAAFLGNNLGAVTQASYVLLGISGLPIFSGAGSGMAYLLGPTGGYLFGFILAAAFVGKTIRYAGNNLFSVFSILCLGDLILLTSGVIWLKILLGYNLAQLLLMGFTPFLPGDILKILFASILYLRLRPRLKEIF